MTAPVRAEFTAFDRSVWRSVGDPLQQGAWEGPLAGLTVAVKDVFAIRGYRIGAGNPEYLRAARAESATAPAVADLLRAGASVRGIARTDEFAYSLAGDNPHYGAPPNGAVPGALPGGSSSGPASAVATGQAEIGLGTDTAGSIRVPASYQGLWGLRTTHGLVPRQGMLPLAQSFDAVGWLTRDGETLQRVADWCLSYDGSDSTESVFGESAEDLPWRFVLPDEVAAVADPATRTAFDAFVAHLAASEDPPGLRGVSVGRPEAMADPFRVVQAAEAWRNNEAWLRDHPGALGDAVAGRFRAAAAIGAPEEQRARAAVAESAAALGEIVREGVLMLPTAPGPAPARDATDIDRIRAATVLMTAPASLAGLPALSVPLLRVPGAEGRTAPVGVCLISRPGTDIALVRLGRRLQRAAAGVRS